MHGPEEHMYRCVKTWNRILELELDLSIIFASEVMFAILEEWPEITPQEMEDSFRRKGFLKQIIETLNSMIIYVPEKMPKHWTKEIKENICYLYNNPQKILP